MSILEELKDYAYACMKNIDTCCQKHRWACLRFINDVNRIGKPDFPYIFDEAKAQRFFDWTKLHKHTKGVLAGQFIEITPIQRFIFGNVFGWVHRDTGYRRFTKAYWQVGRKNAKSQSLAMVGDYELMADGEDMSEVYIGATKADQAKIIYNEVYAMLRRSPEFFGKRGKKWDEKYNTITHLKSDSVLKALSKEDRKTGDGLNPQCGLIDEYHAHATDEILAVIDSGMIARKQPLLFIITTAGTNFTGPCYRVEYPLVSRLLDPNVDFDIPNYFAMVNELDRDEKGNLIDDIEDERAWLKANPIAASYPEGVANIRGRLATAKGAPEKMADFLTKNMNIWVNQSENSYLNMEKWKSRGAIDADTYTVYGYSVYVGFDLSSKIDLTSVGLVIPLETDGERKYIVKGHSFLPESTLNEKEKTDKVPYRLWAQQGYITATPGEVVDYRFMTRWVLDEIERLGLNIKEICYDPYNATYYAQEWENMGYTCVEIRQGVATLSEPTKGFREEVYKGNILHEPNPVLEFALSNAVTKIDAQENIMLDKKKSTQRIDPAAAVINAFVRAKNNDNEDISEYIMSDDYSL